jgi:hypothetical protein
MGAEVRESVAPRTRFAPKTTKRAIIRMTIMVTHYPLSSREGTNDIVRKRGPTNNGCHRPSYRDASC